jgi:hypothetical protein
MGVSVNDRRLSMNTRTIFALTTVVFLVAGAALGLNLFALSAPDRHVYGYGAPNRMPSYLDARHCQTDQVSCTLMVW